MKKLIAFICSAMILFLILGIGVYATDSDNPNEDKSTATTDYDSINIPDSEISSLRSSQNIVDGIVLKLYNGGCLYGFAQRATIAELITKEEYVLEEEFAVIKDMSLSGADLSLYAIRNGEFQQLIYFTVPREDYFIFYQCAFSYDRLFSSSPATMHLDDLTVLNVYCLDGLPSDDGIYVYYVTNYGDYVYYKAYPEATEEYFLPIDEFYEFAEVKYDEMVEQGKHFFDTEHHGETQPETDQQNEEKPRNTDTFDPSDLFWILPPVIIIVGVIAFVGLRKRKEI